MSSRAEAEAASKLLAVIVPLAFPAGAPGEARKQQWDTFVEDALPSLEACRKAGYERLVLAVTQDSLTQKAPFNRGLLCNAGAAMAEAYARDKLHLTPAQAGKQVRLVFHDVDLRGSPRLQQEFLAPKQVTVKRACHFASPWTAKYSYAGFCGGILGVTLKDFADAGGFPNSAWGWGGEDDVLGARLRAARVRIGPVKAFVPAAEVAALTVKDLDAGDQSQDSSEAKTEAPRCGWRRELKQHGATDEARSLDNWRASGYMWRALPGWSWDSEHLVAQALLECRPVALPCALLDDGSAIQPAAVHVRYVEELQDSVLRVRHGRTWPPGMPDIDGLAAFMTMYDSLLTEEEKALLVKTYGPIAAV
jgi:hypothetical protein